MWPPAGQRCPRGHTRHPRAAAVQTRRHGLRALHSRSPSCSIRCRPEMSSRRVRARSSGSPLSERSSSLCAPGASPQLRGTAPRRTGVERSNSRVKDPATIDIGKGWCRLMGLIGPTLFLAAALAIRNLSIATPSRRDGRTTSAASAWGFLHGPGAVGGPRSATSSAHPRSRLHVPAETPCRARLGANRGRTTGTSARPTGLPNASHRHGRMTAARNVKWVLTET